MVLRPTQGDQKTSAVHLPRSIGQSRSERALAPDVDSATLLALMARWLAWWYLFGVSISFHR